MFPGDIFRVNIFRSQYPTFSPTRLTRGAFFRTTLRTIAKDFSFTPGKRPGSTVTVRGIDEL